MANPENKPNFIKRNTPEIATATGILLTFVGVLGPKPNIPAILAGLGMVAYGVDRIEKEGMQSDSRTL